MKLPWDTIWDKLIRRSGFYDTLPCKRNRRRIERLVAKELRALATNEVGKDLGAPVKIQLNPDGRWFTLS